MSTETDLIKPGLIVHEDDAFNAETPLHLLGDRLTPLDRVFQRSNGSLEGVDLSPEGWKLTIDGEVERPLSLFFDDMRSLFPPASITTVMECAGNGRSLFDAKTDGIPWGVGAVACLHFEGARLGDLLAHAGVRPGAVYVGHESPDRTAAGKPALSRGLPIAKALAPETLVAWQVNGAPLPPAHGGPLRIVAPGYPGSAWQKWLSRIWVRDREHDGARMTGLDYRLPRRPILPGVAPDPKDFEVITRMGPRAIITSHRAGTIVAADDDVLVEGWAWGHGTAISKVEISTDQGENWSASTVEPGVSSYAWQRFAAPVRTPGRSAAFTVMPRVTLVTGEMQPLIQAPWNPKGYCNNGCQRLELIARAG
jgi:DMSO/TMAO reductase YedYZ molybdopterin-dependent catalytic subunit